MNLAVNKALVEVIKQQVPLQTQQKLNDLIACKQRFERILDNNGYDICSQCEFLGRVQHIYSCQVCLLLYCSRCIFCIDCQTCAWCKVNCPHAKVTTVHPNRTKLWSTVFALSLTVVPFFACFLNRH